MIATKPKLSEKQKHVIDSAQSELLAGRIEISIGGLAGTGKSTISAKLADNLESAGQKILTLCPTGKAANVQRLKGRKADTIHSAIYNYNGKFKDDDTEKEYISWKDKNDIDEKPDIIIVDEASMVDAKIAGDLRNFNKQIIWVGDYGQLQPVGKDPGIMRHPDYVLDEIFRQDNDIVRFAHGARHGELVTDCNFVDITESAIVDLAADQFDQVICGFNRTRVKFNALYRKHRGLKGKLNEGERLICVHNNRRTGIFNGMQLIVKQIHERGFFYDVTVQFADDRNQERRINVPSHYFGAVKYDTEVGKGISDVVICDYGYAITCHKSQGSEWDHVLVLNQECKAWDQRRWLYTAATRASKHLTVKL